MKKSSFFILVLAITLLVTSCSAAAYPSPAEATPEAIPVASVVLTPTPTATPIPTPEPTREPNGTSFDFAKKYCEIYGDEYTEEFAAAFNHAVWSMPSDYSNINPELPRYLYEHPYNMWAEPTLKKDNAFKTNVGCIEKYGLDEVSAIMEAAKGFAEADINQDYTTIESDATYANFYRHLPSFAENTAYVEGLIKDTIKYDIVRKGVFVTDPSLVYQCADGMFRVRGRSVFKFTHARDGYLTANNVKEETWYWLDFEYNVIPDEKSSETIYVHGAYGTYNWLNISNGWIEADANMIELAEAHMA